MSALLPAAIKSFMRSMAARVGLSLTVLLVSLASSAHGQNVKDRCADAYEAAQFLRLQGQLLEAREQAIACGQAECPDLLQPDCVAWASMLEANIPTFVLAITRDPDSIARVASVFVDGRALDPADLSLAVPMNPGQHRFTVTTDQGATFEQRVVLIEGQKNQRVEFHLPAAPDVDTRELLAKPAVWPIYVLAATSAAGFAGFAIFAIRGNQGYSELERECGRSCGRSKGDPVKTDYLIADVALGVGVTALAVSGYLYLSRSEERKTGSGRSSPRVVAAPIAQGAWVSIEQPF